MSRLLEDYADEWLWRPAMHYRWSYEADARRAAITWPTEVLATCRRRTVLALRASGAASTAGSCATTG